MISSSDSTPELEIIRYTNVRCLKDEGVSAVGYVTCKGREAGLTGEGNASQATEVEYLASAELLMNRSVMSPSSWLISSEQTD